MKVIILQTDGRTDRQTDRQMPPVTLPRHFASGNDDIDEDDYDDDDDDKVINNDAIGQGRLEVLPGVA